MPRCYAFLVVLGVHFPKGELAPRAYRVVEVDFLVAREESISFSRTMFCKKSISS